VPGIEYAPATGDALVKLDDSIHYERVAAQHGCNFDKEPVIQTRLDVDTYHFAHMPNLVVKFLEILPTVYLTGVFDDTSALCKLVVGPLVVNMMELIHAYECDYYEYELAVPTMNVSPQLLVDNLKLSLHIWTYRRRIVIQLVLVWAAIDLRMKMMTEQFAMTMTVAAVDVGVAGAGAAVVVAELAD